MPYVQRENGAVIGLYANAQVGYAEEFLAEDHPEVVAFLSPPPSAADVIAERERRLALGFDYDFGGERGTHRIGTTADDIRKWMDEVSPLSQAYLNLGQPEGMINIDTDTGPISITAIEWQQILLAAAAWRQPLYNASFALQAMNPIPADFADDAYWQMP